VIVPFSSLWLYFSSHDSPIAQITVSTVSQLVALVLVIVKVYCVRWKNAVSDCSFNTKLVCQIYIYIMSRQSITESKLLASFFLYTLTWANLCEGGCRCLIVIFLSLCFFLHLYWISNLLSMCVFAWVGFTDWLSVWLSSHNLFLLHSVHSLLQGLVLWNLTLTKCGVFRLKLILICDYKWCLWTFFFLSVSICIYMHSVPQWL